MAILRCNKCGYIREVPNEYISRSAKCINCQNVVKIHHTIDYLQSIINKYLESVKMAKKIEEELNQYKIIKLDNPKESISLSQDKKQNTNQIQPKNENKKTTQLNNVDLHNTKIFTNEEYYRPIIEWFARRKIFIEVNADAVDSTGFFDEMAVLLGSDIDAYKGIVDKIRYVQQKGFTDVKFNLKDKSQELIKKITFLLQELYKSFFLSKYFYHRESKVIHIKLQTIPLVVRFFNGEWFEWLIYMRLQDFCKEGNISLVALRSLMMELSNKDRYEIDVFGLLNGTTPLYIECKTGEFRSQIEKYMGLRKRVGIDKDNFVVCVLGLSKQECAGLGQMFGLTFANEDTIFEHIKDTLLK